MIDFDSLDELRDFIAYPPPERPADDSPQARARYHDFVLDWLAEAGFASPDRAPADEAMMRGDSVSLFVWGIDNGGNALVFAVPDACIDDTQRAAFERVGGSVFEFYFHRDLSPPEYPGALWALALFLAPGEVEGNLEQLVWRTGLDAETVRAQLGAWERFHVTRADQLDAPISHLYTGCLAT